MAPDANIVAVNEKLSSLQEGDGGEENHKAERWGWISSGGTGDKRINCSVFIRGELLYTRGILERKSKKFHKAMEDFEAAVKLLSEGDALYAKALHEHGTFQHFKVQPSHSQPLPFFRLARGV